ncbi:hypothetical protein F5Y14DRAFT_457425 [Nemania sp. NC0429]|nr:hypothetical protein F5Y14DRAFT_457425 [Nemania sp. NC0429]
MLWQYMAYKEYIDWKLLVTEADLDDDMVQDAMAIILFPPRDNAGLLESVPQRHHFDEWSSKRFPNPLKVRPLMNVKDKSLVKEIAKLYYRQLVFIEDYVTKATAACPSKDYLCLPHPSGVLEREAVFCVEIYLGSLYGALLAQCGDSDPPENPPLIHTNQMPREFSRHYAPALTDLSTAEELIYWTNRSLNADELCLWLGCLGFDLAMTLIAGITAGPRRGAIIGQWFKHIAKRAPRCGQHRSWYSRRPAHSLLIGESSGGVNGEDVICRAGPGLYQMLYPRLQAMKAL